MKDSYMSLAITNLRLANSDQCLLTYLRWKWESKQFLLNLLLNLAQTNPFTSRIQMAIWKDSTLKGRNQRDKIGTKSLCQLLQSFQLPILALIDKRTLRVTVSFHRQRRLLSESNSSLILTLDILNQGLLNTLLVSPLDSFWKTRLNKAKIVNSER